MEFTKRFLRAKSPCADGFRWFSRNVQDGAGYQQALDTLVAAGRVDDACWLLDQFGPTNEVLTLDTLDAEALVFAGTLVVRGAIAADRLRVGRALRAGAGLRTDGNLGVGEDLRVEGALACGGALKVGGNVRCAWGIEVKGAFEGGGDARAAWDLLCHGPLTLAGHALVGQDLLVQADTACGKGLRVGGQIDCAGNLRAGHGILAGGSITATGHIEAGWGIRAAHDIAAQGAIKAGESLVAEGLIRAGAGYGIYAGLNVQRDAWEASAQVRARQRPTELLSGCWLA